MLRFEFHHDGMPTTNYLSPFHQVHSDSTEPEVAIIIIMPHPFNKIRVQHS